MPEYEPGFNPDKDRDSDEEELQMAAALLSKVKTGQGDSEGAKKWGKVAGDFDPDDLSEENRQDFNEASQALEILQKIKGDKRNESKPKMDDEFAAAVSRHRKMNKVEMIRPCSGCGRAIPSDSNFCGFCGKDLR